MRVRLDGFWDVGVLMSRLVLASSGLVLRLCSLENTGSAGGGGILGGFAGGSLLFCAAGFPNICGQYGSAILLVFAETPAERYGKGVVA